MIAEAQLEIVVVTGPPRCGTTLLASILSQPPAHPYLPECSVITDFIRERVRSEAVQHPLKFDSFLGSSADADRLYKGLIETIFRRVLEKNGSVFPTIVLKDPYLLFFVSLLPRILPWPFKLISIIRDPRDAVASHMEVCRRGEEEVSAQRSVGFLKKFYLALPIVADTTPVRQPSLVVRYEDLVRQHAPTIQDIEAHVGYSVDLRDYLGAPVGSMDLESPWHTDSYMQAISQSRVGAYSGSLSSSDINLVDKEFSGVIALIKQYTSLTANSRLTV